MTVPQDCQRLRQSPSHESPPVPHKLDSSWATDSDAAASATEPELWSQWPRRRPSPGVVVIRVVTRDRPVRWSSGTVTVTVAAAGPPPAGPMAPARSRPRPIWHGPCLGAGTGVTSPLPGYCTNRDSDSLSRYHRSPGKLARHRRRRPRWHPGAVRVRQRVTVPVHGHDSVRDTASLRVSLSHGH